jgi:pimeloyl-ACP methyl ester carboxylesterase
MAMGGATGGLGAKVGEMVKMVAEHVEVVTLPDGGHFLPEECPDEVARRILVVAADLRSRSQLSKEKII